MTATVEQDLKLRLDPLQPQVTLAPDLAALRDQVLAAHQSDYGWRPIPALAEIDADAWQRHTPGEDWLLWRARRTHERLTRMPIEILPGETVVGRPARRPLTPDDEARLARAQQALASMPPFPGGDAGHFHPDFEKLFAVGIGGLRAELASRLATTETPDRRCFYQACDLAVEGMQQYAIRLGACCAEQGRADLAAICRRVATEPPATFHEAIQLMWIAIIALWFGDDHGLTTPGRLDQTLRPFYEADLAAGRLDPGQALDLLCCLYIQCNRILWPGSAISVIVGGRNARGQDVTNDLTYLALAARWLTRLVYPTVGIAWHAATPPELTRYACRMLANGGGDPAFFNDEVIALGLRDHGVSVPDSYNWMNSTCVEIKVCGCSNMWVTQPYFNLAQAVLDVLARVAAAPPPDFAAFETLLRDQVAATVRQAAERLDDVWRRRAEHGCFPLASALIADCLERGLDYDRGGARYHWVENSFVGLANLVDSLIAIRTLVYERGQLSLAALHEALQANFAGHEELRQQLRCLPCYGNDDRQADDLAAAWADFLSDTTEANRIGDHRYVPGFFCWIQHERLGKFTGATPDGRLAGVPLADGAGASQGRERRGPTASILSTTSWSHRRVLGGLVHNAKFSRTHLRDDAGRKAMEAVIATYLRRGGFEIQMNVVGADELRDAQVHPDRHQDLLVRVAGYSDYFIHLTRAMQDEVIARTEFELDR